jgi:hypothetical protein
MSHVINRREAIQRVAALMGGAVSAPAILGVLNGCSAKPNTNWKPAFLSEAQGAVVSEVAEIMIPRTETPGAIDVGVPAFIDIMLKDAYSEKERQRFVSELEAFDARAQREQGRAFVKLSPEKKASFVKTVHDAAVEEQQQLKLPASRMQRPFILVTKELALLGFFTSEAGATQVLQYQQVPGALHACIPIQEAGNGKTWALETSGAF